MDVSEESEENATFLLLLDAIPAVVILASAAVAGVSADVAPGHWFWPVMEALFTVFFIGEMLLKISIFGLKDFFWGSDWRLVTDALNIHIYLYVYRVYFLLSSLEVGRRVTLP